MKSTPAAKPARPRAPRTAADPARRDDGVAAAKPAARRVEHRGPQGILGVLVAPLRVPQRIAADIATIASAVVALQRDAHDRLTSVDDRAGALVTGVDALRAPLGRVERKVAELASLEEAVTLRMDAVHHDLNTRMLAVEAEVHAMRRPIEQMSRDLTAAVALLPNPSDGPLARLRDTLTAN
jgi:hypothetical protein